MDGEKKNNKQHNRWFARIFFFFLNREKNLSIFLHDFFCAFVNNDHKLATKRHNQYIYSKHTFIRSFVRSFSSLDIQYWHSPEESLFVSYYSNSDVRIDFVIRIYNSRSRIRIRIRICIRYLHEGYTIYLLFEQAYRCRNAIENTKNNDK